MKYSLILICFLSLSVQADPYIDYRYLTIDKEILRNSDGSIKRNLNVLKEFQKIHPCPATGLTTGKCVGWEKDHIIPLACRGADIVTNLQWLDKETKALKDKYERTIYAPQGFVLLGCKSKFKAS